MKTLTPIVPVAEESTSSGLLMGSLRYHPAKTTLFKKIQELESGDHQEKLKCRRM